MAFIVFAALLIVGVLALVALLYLLVRRRL
jgi:hypothetical protein